MQFKFYISISTHTRGIIIPTVGKSQDVIGTIVVVIMMQSLFIVNYYRLYEKYIYLPIITAECRVVIY